MDRTPGNRRIALLLQYDGTKFNGFQLQDKGRTVQGELERALKILTKTDIRIAASGRTDTGVHALGQIAHFDTDSELTLRKFAISLNGIMTSDISVKNVFEVSSDFHSRYSAVEREYRYLIYNHPQRSPFMLYRAMWVNSLLDIDYLREAVSYLVGEKDFASFCKKKSREEKTVRRINDIGVNKHEELVEIVIRGNAFLHNMNRIIIGTLIEMSKDKRPPEYMLDILDAKAREASGFTAPPYGLYLSRIWFDPDLAGFPSAFESL